MRCKCLDHTPCGEELKAEDFYPSNKSVCKKCLILREKKKRSGVKSKIYYRARKSRPETDTENRYSKKGPAVEQSFFEYCREYNRTHPFIPKSQTAAYLRRQEI